MTLRVITGGKDTTPQNAWAQRTNEDEAEYLLFLQWLHEKAPRSSPSYAAIASHHEWSERASAYDLTVSMPATATGKAARAWRDLEDVFTTEARKLSNETKKNGSERVLTVKDIITLGVVMADNREALKRILEQDESEEAELSELSDEELRALQAAQVAVKRIGKKKK